MRRRLLLKTIRRCQRASVPSGHGDSSIAIGLRVPVVRDWPCLEDRELFYEDSLHDARHRRRRIRNDGPGRRFVSGLTAILECILRGADTVSLKLYIAEK